MASCEGRSHIKLKKISKIEYLRGIKKGEQDYVINGFALYSSVSSPHTNRSTWLPGNTLLLL